MAFGFYRIQRGVQPGSGEGGTCRAPALSRPILDWEEGGLIGDGVRSRDDARAGSGEMTGVSFFWIARIKSGDLWVCQADKPHAVA